MIGKLGWAICMACAEGNYLECGRQEAPVFWDQMANMHSNSIGDSDNFLSACSYQHCT